MDLNKLTMGDKVIAGSGIALFIFSFFPWFGFDFGFGARATANGWDVGFLWGGLPALLGLALAAVVLIPLFAADFKLPDLPITWGQALLGAAAVAAFFVILKLLIGESGLNREIGMFLSALAAAGLAAGGFLKFQEEQKGASAPGNTPPSSF
ncbi:MAG: hypothetical protein ACXIVQ_18160 [Acidimicrobiales bacterium]